mmetsp:Transcript_15637/g.21181  ORF Transcript_15637/g.21181 Transcript_15637/m.21181 type:complete len:121 (+) Transcript_15637:882-1244(+)
MNKDYMEAVQVNKTAKVNSSGKVSFAVLPDTEDEKEKPLGNQTDLAFRKKARNALNMEKKIMKKLELHSYLEEMRSKANHNIFDFFKGIDPNTAPRNLRLMYYYYLSSTDLYASMQQESI